MTSGPGFLLEAVIPLETHPAGTLSAAGPAQEAASARRGSRDAVKESFSIRKCCFAEILKTIQGLGTALLGAAWPFLGTHGVHGDSSS